MKVNRVEKGMRHAKEVLPLLLLLLLLCFWSHTQEKATSNVSSGERERVADESADDPFEILNGASVLPVTRPSFPRKHKEHYA